jgi:hypothetical protein
MFRGRQKKPNGRPLFSGVAEISNAAGLSQMRTWR